MRTKIDFLGYNLGFADDWDGSYMALTFADWSPTDSDIAVRIPNATGETLTLDIDFETGKVRVATSHEDPALDDLTIIECSWRDFIGHKLPERSL